MAAAATPSISLVVQGTTRQFSIASVRLTPKDLRLLFRLLETKAVEAAGKQVSSFTLLPGQTQQQLDEVKQQCRADLSLVLSIQTLSGKWINGTTADPLTDEQLPEGISRIEFNSSLLYRAKVNAPPSNWFTVVLDLNRTPVLDLNSTPMLNSSTVTIHGLDPTWVNGLSDELDRFFSDRASWRGWLHLEQSYTALVCLMGFPLSLDAVYHLDKLIRTRSALPESITVAVYVYVVLMVLFLFRLTFNYARWVFPKLELEAPRQHAAVSHRIAISALGLIILGTLIRAALKLVGIG